MCIFIVDLENALQLDLEVFEKIMKQFQGNKCKTLKKAEEKEDEISNRQV